MADKSMVEYNDYAMESTGLTGMVSSGLPEIAGEKTKMKKRKPKERYPLFQRHGSNGGGGRPDALAAEPRGHHGNGRPRLYGCGRPFP